MDEYIKRSDVIDLIEVAIGKCKTVHTVLVCSHLRTAVMGLRSADVAPRAEIDKLQEVNADLNESLRLACEANKDLQVELRAMRGAANSYKMHYESLAREIFAEIKEKGSFSDPCVLHIVLSFEELAEIEKKYTEEQ